MKYLIIDDYIPLIRSWQRYFKGRDNVMIEECHSVEDAVAAIAKHGPDVVLLDHYLTGRGEGLEIADWIKENYPAIKIYSISNSDSLELFRAYTERGIEIVGKDIRKICRLIEGDRQIEGT